MLGLYEKKKLEEQQTKKELFCNLTSSLYKTLLHLVVIPQMLLFIALRVASFLWELSADIWQQWQVFWCAALELHGTADSPGNREINTSFFINVWETFRARVKHNHRGQCLQVFAPSLYLIEELRSLISKKFPHLVVIERRNQKPADTRPTMEWV